MIRKTLRNTQAATFCREKGTEGIFSAQLGTDQNLIPPSPFLLGLIFLAIPFSPKVAITRHSYIREITVRLSYCIATLIVSSVQFGCSAAPSRIDGTSLLAPTGLSIVQRKNDLSICYEKAYEQANSKQNLSPSERALLGNRSTIRFFRDGHYVFNSDYLPSMYLSAIDPIGGYGDPEVTDRYVLCFLHRGYTWPPSRNEKNQ